MGLDTKQKEIISGVAGGFGSVTAEEISGGKDTDVKPEVLLSEGEMKAVAGALQEIANAKDQKKLALIASKVKTGKKAGKYNKNQVNVIKEAYITRLKNLSFAK